MLVDDSGPVIIDLPQAVNAASNNNARMMLERDVNNMRNYFGQFAPELLTTGYAGEIWSHYEAGELTPDIKLTGIFAESTELADVDDLLEVIDDAREEEMERRRWEQESR